MYFTKFGTLAVCAALAFAASSARAAVVSLTPTLDTYIRISGSDSGAQSTSTTLRTRSSTATDNSRAVIRFTIPSDLAGATITSATLSLTEDYQGHDNNKITYLAGLNEAYDHWDSSLNFTNSTNAADAVEYIGNNTPATSEAPTSTNNWGFINGAITGVMNSDGAWGPATSDSTVTPGRTIAFNLLTNGSGFADLVNADTNQSITLVMLASGTVYANSMDATAGIPTLTIDYTPAAAPEPASLGVLALGGLGLLARRRRA